MLFLYRRFALKSKGDFESLYSKTVKECVSLVDEECKLEQEQISLALKMGKKIDQLVTDAAQGEAIIPKLARDIFKERQKIIPASKLFEYRQLYLNLGSMETVKTLAATALNDVSLYSLLKSTGVAKGATDGSNLQKSEIVSILDRVVKSLDRVDRMLQSRQLNDDELAEIQKIMGVVQDKAGSLFKAVQVSSGQGQMDLFRTVTGSDGSAMLSMN
jgi:hypothetical protein